MPERWIVGTSIQSNSDAKVCSFITYERTALIAVLQVLASIPSIELKMKKERDWYATEHNQDINIDGRIYTAEELHD